MYQLDSEMQSAIEAFLAADVLYDTVEVCAGTLIDPPEYADYCKLCNAQEREHNSGCLFYPLFMAL